MTLNAEVQDSKVYMIEIFSISYRHLRNVRLALCPTYAFTHIDWKGSPTDCRMHNASQAKYSAHI